MKPKVSVIIPYYNDGKYIFETLMSVEKQTYPNLEVILIDDGSTEKESIRVFDSIESKRVIKIHEANQGPASARNLGIMNASGKYILPLDADDKIDPSYIEKAVTILEGSPRCGIVYCESSFFGLSRVKWNLPQFTIGRMLVSNIIFNAGVFRKEDWQNCGGYDNSLTIGVEDWDFWLSILELGREVIQIPESLFYYRIKSASRNQNFSHDRDNFQKTYMRIQNKHRFLYQKYFDEYLLESRKYMIEQDLELKHMQDQCLKGKISKTFPLVRKIWHIILDKVTVII